MLRSINRKYRRIVIDAYAHEAIIGGNIVDALWDRFPHGVIREAVHVEFPGGYIAEVHAPSGVASR